VTLFDFVPVLSAVVVHGASPPFFSPLGFSLVFPNHATFFFAECASPPPWLFLVLRKPFESLRTVDPRFLTLPCALAFSLFFSCTGDPLASVPLLSNLSYRIDSRDSRGFFFPNIFFPLLRWFEFWFFFFFLWGPSTGFVLPPIEVNVPPLNSNALEKEGMRWLSFPFFFFQSHSPPPQSAPHLV